MTRIFSQTREFESNPSHDSTSKKGSSLLNSSRVWAKNWPNPSRIRVEFESRKKSEFVTSSSRVRIKFEFESEKIRVESSQVEFEDDLRTIFGPFLGPFLPFFLNN